MKASLERRVNAVETKRRETDAQDEQRRWDEMSDEELDEIVLNEMGPPSPIRPTNGDCLDRFSDAELLAIIYGR
jgi:hypothetical protein